MNLCKNGHVPLVTMAGVLPGFKRKYWVRCWRCSLKIGPYHDGPEAHRKVDAINANGGKVPIEDVELPPL